MKKKKGWAKEKYIIIPSKIWGYSYFDVTKNFQNFEKEMDIMKKLHHPNLVKMYGICVDKLPFYIILVD